MPVLIGLDLCFVLLTFRSLFYLKSQRSFTKKHSVCSICITIKLQQKVGMYEEQILIVVDNLYCVKIVIVGYAKFLLLFTTNTPPYQQPTNIRK